MTDDQHERPARGFAAPLGSVSVAPETSEVDTAAPEVLAPPGQAPPAEPPIVIDLTENDLTTGPHRRVSDAIRPWYQRHRRRVDPLLYVAATVGAWSVRFMQDDSFITFRYARNLAEGRGLVFNPGERVEGYSNFLWTLVMALPERLGWNTPLFSQVVSLAAFVATLAVSWRLARRVLRDDALALIAMVVLVTNMTFLSYATGGLETMLQTLLVVSLLATLLPVARFDGAPLMWRHLAAGVLAGLAVLTRLDSAVLVATIAAVHVVQLARLTPVADRGRRVVGAVAALGAPVLVLVVPWLAWKLTYYGHLLPNTFTAKSRGNPLGQVLFVLVYFAAFFLGYFLFLLIGRWRRYRHYFFSLPGARGMFWIVPVWLLYIAAAGGDFMEFRFMVPIMPVLALLGAVLIDHYRRVGLQIALVAALLFASFGHVELPSLGYPVHTFHDLRIWPSESPQALESIGERLAATFPGGLDRPDQVVMSIGAVGALPYYSQVPTIDMEGLTDRHVATEGVSNKMYYPGHLRTAPIDFLIKRKVNLVAGFPLPVARDPHRKAYRLSELIDVYAEVDLHELPKGATAVEIPMDEKSAWVAIYLTPHPKVERAIEQEGWRRFPIERTCRDSDINSLEQLVDGTCE